MFTGQPEPCIPYVEKAIRLNPGITDDLTTDLSRISDSFVIARNTAFGYKVKPSMQNRSHMN
jgi:TolB-like protein